MAAVTSDDVGKSGAAPEDHDPGLAGVKGMEDLCQGVQLAAHKSVDLRAAAQCQIDHLFGKIMAGQEIKGTERHFGQSLQAGFQG
jgi:hypothetical protein